MVAVAVVALRVARVVDEGLVYKECGNILSQCYLRLTRHTQLSTTALPCTTLQLLASALTLRPTP